MSTSSNHQLADFFRSHNHFTKLNNEEFEFVEALLFGKSVQSSFASLPSSFTPLGPQRTPSSLLSASVGRQPPPSLIVPSSVQKKKLLFITEEPKMIHESPKQSVQVEPTPIIPEPESRPMTSAAKHLMASLLSVGDEGSEDVQMTSKQFNYNQEASVASQPEPQSYINPEIEPAPLSLPQFNFDLSEYQTSKGYDTNPDVSDNLPKFNFKF